MDEPEDESGIIFIAVLLLLEIGIDEGVWLLLFLVVLGEDFTQRLLFELDGGLQFDEDVFHQQ
jgi:hypothetical protein